MSGFFFAQPSGTNPWARVLYKHPGGAETLYIDFIFEDKSEVQFVASKIAHAANVKMRDIPEYSKIQDDPLFRRIALEAMSAKVGPTG